MKAQTKNTLVLYTALIKGYTVNKKGELFNPMGAKLKAGYTSGGYLRVRISLKGVRDNLFVHRFVALCKFGVKVFQNDCIRHLDGNPQNNSWSNIALGSHSANQMDIPKQVRRERGALGFKQYDHKQVLSLYTEGKSYKDIMGITGIKSKSTVNHILKHSLLVTT